MKLRHVCSTVTTPLCVNKLLIIHQLWSLQALRPHPASLHSFSLCLLCAVSPISG